MTDSILVITGATGFVGVHLAKLASDSGLRVWAVGRDDAPRASLAPHCERYFGVDLATGWPVPAGEADAVIHLAGLASVGRSFSEPQQYIDENSAMVTHMAESMLRSGERPRVVVVSSGSVYAPQDDGRSIDETAPLIATSPYAVAKVLVETQAGYYATRGLDVVIARPFNHIGPGQGRGFLVPDLTAALRALPDDEALAVGNLDTARDYTDVRDVANAYLTLATAPSHRHAVYNVASGASRTGREILTTIADALGRPVPDLVVDPARLRPGDPLRITGSADRLRQEFGWVPVIDPGTSIRQYVAGDDESEAG